MLDDSAACGRWDPGGCEGTPYCPPRCPRFFDATGRPLLIGPYEAADHEALIQMYARLDDESRTRGIPPRDREHLAEWLDGLLARGFHLVAREDEAVVGHVGVVPADADEPEGLIFVDDAAQGRGIGGELLRQLIAYGADRAVEAIRLDVAAHNRTAIGVFRHLGFEVVDRNIDEVELSLTMDDPVAEAVRLPPAEREE